MAKKLNAWIKEDVQPFLDRNINWLSSEFFLRDPKRINYFDRNHFFSPADGIIIYQKYVKPDEKVIEIKGVNYTLKKLMADEDFNENCYVIGIFMTFYNVHINRIPYSGFLSYQDLDPIQSYNLPMLAEENKLLENIIDFSSAQYMWNNQKVFNTIFAPTLKQFYYIVQIADYDVKCILPFKREQNEKFFQNERFSVIRWGSQVDLVIPESRLFDFEFCLEKGDVVEAGLDKLIKIKPKL
jgi:phosphatidylserine decarboxylase